MARRQRGTAPPARVGTGEAEVETTRGGCATRGLWLSIPVRTRAGGAVAWGLRNEAGVETTGGGCATRGLWLSIPCADTGRRRRATGDEAEVEATRGGCATRGPWLSFPCADTGPEAPCHGDAPRVDFGCLFLVQTRAGGAVPRGFATFGLWLSFPCADTGRRRRATGEGSEVVRSSEAQAEIAVSVDDSADIGDPAAPEAEGGSQQQSEVLFGFEIQGAQLAVDV